MINYADCLRYYAKYIRWHVYNSDKYWCDYYQNQCRFYLNEVN